MESSVFDYEVIKTNSTFKIKIYHDACYKGEIVDGKRTGKGVMIYKSGRIYEGDWVVDQRTGRGYERN